MIVLLFIAGQTIQQKEDGATYRLGTRDRVRQLKKDGYGKFAMQEAGGESDGSKFNEQCSCCHASGVDSKAKTFTYFGDLRAVTSVRRQCVEDLEAAVSGQFHCGRHLVSGPEGGLGKGGRSAAECGRPACVPQLSAMSPRTDRRLPQDTWCGSARNPRVLTNESCLDCHNAEGPKKGRHELHCEGCALRVWMTCWHC